MLRKLALAGAMLFALAVPSHAAICPASMLANLSGQNAIALQTFIEKVCANLDTLAAGNKATYNVTAIGYTAYATPTDLVCLKGSDTKTTRVVQLGIRIQTTSAALQTIYFIKRSTANSGGTSTNPTPVPHDSTDAAATAVPIVYTAAPAALGTAAGTVNIFLSLSATLTTGPGLISAYTVPTPTGITDYRQTIVLRGAAESLCINYNGAALTSGFTAEYEMVWTEE
jgi:hypothetical protein